MSFLEFLKIRLWPIKPANNRVLLCETFERSAADKEDLRKWLESPEPEQWQSFLLQEFRLCRTEKKPDTILRFFNSRIAKGFVLRYPASMSALHFQHLFDFFKDRMLESGYQLSSSSRKVFENPGEEEVLERYHLRPVSRKIQTGIENAPFHDYGNINIELYRVDNYPTHIKFYAIQPQLGTNDPNHESFADLIMFLCKHEA